MSSETAPVSSVNGLQEKIQQLQAELNARIQEAQAKGDWTGIPALTAEFQAKLLALTQPAQSGGSADGSPDHDAPAAPPAEDPALHLYDNPGCLVDLNLAVYEGERKALLSLTTDADFTKVADEIMANHPAGPSQKHLLKKAMRLTPAIAPRVHAVAAHCKKALGLAQDLDLFVYQDVYFNASCYPADEKRIYVLLTSSLMEKFNDEELTFVLGHEIGHALLRHHRYAVRLLLEEGHGEFSPLQALKLYSWSRNAEASADRIGLLCGQNFEAAARAFFKLSSGLCDPAMSFPIDDYLGQFKDLKEQLKQSDQDPSDWYTSHPFSPLRLKALELFAKSQKYHRLTGREGGEVPDQDLETEIYGFMSLLDPTCLQDNGEATTAIKEFIFLGGFLIAAANGVVEPSEIKAIASMVDQETFQKGVQKINGSTVDKIREELAGLAEKLNLVLPVVGKLNVIRDLTVVSYADGSVEQSEVDVLYDICDLLNIKTQFVDNVLESALKSH